MLAMKLPPRGYQNSESQPGRRPSSPAASQVVEHGESADDNERLSYTLRGSNLSLRSIVVNRRGLVNWPQMKAGKGTGKVKVDGTVPVTLSPLPRSLTRPAKHREAVHEMNPGRFR